MSKSFEECYKTELLNELPDLWSRIEQGIKAGNTEKTLTETTVGQTEEIKEQKVENVAAKSVSGRKKKNVFLMYAIPVMAACVLGVIILPVGQIFLSSDKSASIGAAAADMYESADGMGAMEDCAPESVKQNRVEGIDAEEMVAEEAVTEDIAVMGEAALPIAEITIEVVAVEEDRVTFCILDENAEQLAKQYRLTQENGNYVCVCETPEDAVIQPNVRYEAYLREEGDEIFLGILTEKNE